MLMLNWSAVCELPLSCTLVCCALAAIVAAIAWRIDSYNDDLSYIIPCHASLFKDLAFIRLIASASGTSVTMLICHAS